jgi:hypothetical protein
MPTLQLGSIMVAEDDVLSTSSQPAAEHTSPPASETVSMPATTKTTLDWDAKQCLMLSQRDAARSRPASSTFDVLSPADKTGSEARVSPSHPTMTTTTINTTSMINTAHAKDALPAAAAAASDGEGAGASEACLHTCLMPVQGASHCVLRASANTMMHDDHDDNSVRGASNATTQASAGDSMLVQAAALRQPLTSTADIGRGGPHSQASPSAGDSSDGPARPASLPPSLHAAPAASDGSAPGDSPCMLPSSPTADSNYLGCRGPRGSDSSAGSLRAEPQQPLHILTSAPHWQDSMPLARKPINPRMQASFSTSWDGAVSTLARLCGSPLREPYAQLLKTIGYEGIHAVSEGRHERFNAAYDMLRAMPAMRGRQDSNGRMIYVLPPMRRQEGVWIVWEADVLHSSACRVDVWHSSAVAPSPPSNIMHQISTWQ